MTVIRPGKGFRHRDEPFHLASQGIYDEETLEFIKAIDDYKRVNKRKFPSWFEVFLVVKSLGYKRSNSQSTDQRIVP